VKAVQFVAALTRTSWQRVGLRRNSLEETKSWITLKDRIIASGETNLLKAKGKQPRLQFRSLLLKKRAGRGEWRLGGNRRLNKSEEARKRTENEGGTDLPPEQNKNRQSERQTTSSSTLKEKGGKEVGYIPTSTYFRRKKKKETKGEENKRCFKRGNWNRNQKKKGSNGLTESVVTRKKEASYDGGNRTAVD